MWKTLLKFGFPQQMITWLQSLYTNATSKFLVNGCLSESVTLYKSVRQGCPLSMALFVICMEPFIRTIDRDITGVNIYRMNLKVRAYCDDVCVFVKDERDTNIVKNVLAKFRQVSGACVPQKKQLLPPQ